MFTLKILVVDFFAEDLASMFARFSPKVEFIIPPYELTRNVEKLRIFIKESDAQVVFLEQASLPYPVTGADLFEACDGKVVYDTTLIEYFGCNQENIPEFPRNSTGASLLPSAFLYHDGMSEALLMAFIHNLRHFIERQVVEKEEKSE